MTSRQREHQLRFPKEEKSRRDLTLAIESGMVVRPDRCQFCGASCVPHGHHADYERPLDVCWLCSSCHSMAHRIIRGSVDRAIARAEQKAIPTGDAIVSAARALGSMRSEKKAQAGRENGKKGGRPARYLLVDDLGRCVGETRRPGPAGLHTEYGLRTSGGFRAEGHAKLVRPSEWKGSVPDRRWDS